MPEHDPANGRKFSDTGPISTEELVSTTMGAGRRVALTFDDGPDPLYTPQVLDILAAQGIVATFCLVGAKALRFPELVARIAGAGHALCNHTMNHADLAGLPLEEVRAEIAGASEAIMAAAPGVPLRYFRAPFGSWTPFVRVAAGELELQPLDWSVNPGDWADPGVREIVTVVERDLRPGGVVLMHDSRADVFEGDSGRWQTVAALRELVPWLVDQGYAFDVPALPADRER